MSKQLYWLSDAEWTRLEPLLPRGRRGAHRVDDRRVYQRHRAHAAIGGALARLPAGIRALHDDLQSLQSLEPAGHLVRDVRGP